MSPEEWMVSKGKPLTSLKPTTTEGALKIDINGTSSTPPREEGDGGVGVGLTRGVAPAAVGAAVGGGLGALLGGVGAVPGAMIGAGAMTGADALVGMINPSWGMQGRMSAMGMPEAGPGAPQVAQAMTAGVGSAVGLSGLSGALQTHVKSGLTQRVLAELAARPGIAAMYGAGGAGASDMARQSGAGPWTQLGVGMAAPMGAGLGLRAIGSIPGHIPGVSYAMQRIARLLHSGAGAEPPRAEATRQATQALSADPQYRAAGRVGEAVSAGAQTELAAGEQAAAAARAQGQQDASQVLATGNTQAATTLADGKAKASITLAAKEAWSRAANLIGLEQNRQQTIYLTRQLEDAAKRVEGTHAQVGKPKELSEIGEALRTPAVATKEAAEKARYAQFDADQKARDAIVNARQSKGEHVEGIKSFKEFMQELKDRLLLGEAKVTKTVEDIKDPKRRSAFQTLYEGIRSRELSVTQQQARRIEEAGGKVVQRADPITGEIVFYKKFPSSFEAIDDLRRRMGKASRFDEKVEGYEGLSSTDAKWAYAKLTAIQKEFVEGVPGGIKDGAQSKLLTNYSEGKAGEVIFETKQGKALTAMIKGSEDLAAKSAADLPATIFKDKDSVTRAIELTGGNKALIEEQARSYAAKETQNITNPAKLGEWTSKNSDWLKEFPELQKNLQRHQQSLQGAEDLAARTREVEKSMRRAQAKVEKGAAPSREALAEAAKTEREAGIEAGKIQQRVTAEARKITAEAEARAREIQTQATTLTKDLIVEPTKAREFMSNFVGKKFSPDETRLIGEAIKADPAALKAFPAALKQALADSPAGRMPDGRARILADWQGGLRQLVESTGLIQPKDLREIDTAIQAINNAVEGPRKAKRLIEKIIGNALAAGTGAGVAVMKGVAQ